jgi:hypothetical protein
MNEFMTHVERIVRPIRGDSSKLRIRRELLAHLQASFEQEKARGLDDAAAATEAKRRLGDPSALTQELQASIPAWERWADTPFPQIVRFFVLAIAALIPIVVSIKTIHGPASHQARAIFISGVVVLELELLLWLGAVIAILRPKPSWQRAGLLGVAACAAQVAWLSLLSLSLTGRVVLSDFSHHMWEYLSLPLCCLLFGLSGAVVKIPYRQWLAIEIVD